MTLTVADADSRSAASRASMRGPARRASVVFSIAVTGHLSVQLVVCVPADVLRPTHTVRVGVTRRLGALPNPGQIGVGGVTETNVNLASASDAIIIGFNVRAEGKATELANREGVDIRYYSVIYQAIDEIQSALKGMLKPVYEEVELGRAEIRAIFRSSKVGNIAGCLVTSGVMRRNAKARLLRDNIVVAENLTISSLRREKDDVTEVRDGYECGLTLTYNDIKEGDVIETYELVEKERA